MIDEETKKQLLKEIQRFGIITVACAKTSIDKATYYRWRKDDPIFRKRADIAVRIGRSNTDDLAEYALVGNVKKGMQRSIEYYPSHRSARYRPKKTQDYNFSYRKVPIEIPPARSRTLEDLLDEGEAKYVERADAIIERYKDIGGIPLRIDGTSIPYEELVRFEPYIEDYYRAKRKDGSEKNNVTDPPIG
jgi:hypothetical protein